jgi:hypothetical protein
MLLGGDGPSLKLAHTLHTETTKHTRRTRLYATHAPFGEVGALDLASCQPEQLELHWRRFVEVETSKRLVLHRRLSSVVLRSVSSTLMDASFCLTSLAHCLLVGDSWFSLLVDDFRPPEYSLLEIGTGFPCSEEMWRAPDAQSWAQAAASADGLSNTHRSVSTWLVSVLKGGAVEPLRSSLDLKSALTLLHLHIRCRRLGSLEDEWTPDSQ